LASWRADDVTDKENTHEGSLQLIEPGSKESLRCVNGNQVGLQSIATKHGVGCNFCRRAQGDLMKHGLRFAVGFFFPSLLVAASWPAQTGLVSRDADVNGQKLHYPMGGHGPAVVLLHGFAETSRMWKPILPVLSEKFTVIAPDLPGMGDSSRPTNGLNMQDAATSMHCLVRSLGIEKARVVGHDIGLMVAYAYAAQFPSEVEKRVVMDAFLPGVEGWEQIYNNPAIWHFRFNGPKPEALVKEASKSTFRFSGMTLLLTRHARFQKPAGRRISKRIPVRAADVEGLRAACSNPADHAGSGDWR
jgi:pimeloyl-ACP methyl ester carboxylesterase